MFHYYYFFQTLESIINSTLILDLSKKIKFDFKPICSFIECRKTDIPRAMFGSIFSIRSTRASYSEIRSMLPPDRFFRFDWSIHQMSKNRHLMRAMSDLFFSRFDCPVHRMWVEKPTFDCRFREAWNCSNLLQAYIWISMKNSIYIVQKGSFYRFYKFNIFLFNILKLELKGQTHY